MLLHDRFEYYARSRGDSCFARCGDQALSYAEAGHRAERMAHAMVRSGLQAGDRLAYVGFNGIDHALVYYATSRIGVVVVPLNPRLTAGELSFIVGDSGARAVMADVELCERLGPLRASLPDVETWVAVGDGSSPRAGAASRPGSRDGPTGELEHRGRPDDVLYQMYTSGTTGLAQGCPAHPPQRASPTARRSAPGSPTRSSRVTGG